MLKEVKKKAKALEFGFVDGRVLEIPTSWLRSRCSCALCVANSAQSQPLFLTTAESQAFESVKKMEPVGNYAFSVTWGDSHRSIYSYERIFLEFENIPWPEHLRANLNPAQESAS